MRDLKSVKYKKEGFHSGTEEEVIQFAERHPLGSRARLAMALMRFTGMRRSDAVALGPDAIKDGWITFTPEKTKRKTGKVLTLPVLPEPREIIAATPARGPGDILGDRAWPAVHVKRLRQLFRYRCDEADLKHCTAHGLRKAGAAIAAENGATEKQMMAIFGWSTSDLAAYYSRAASQKKLADEAMHLLVPKKA